MNIHHRLEGLRQLSPGSVLSIGNFDGVHRGHQSLLRMARELRASTPGSRVAVVTFEPHPLTVLRPEKAPPRLLTPEMKRLLLAAEGVDDLVELAPEPAVLNLTAEQFWALLRDEVRPAHLVEGREFNFGKDRGGNIARLREWVAGSGIQLHVAGEVEMPLLDMRLVPISSTLVRWLVAYGRVRDAAICLGRPYALQGEVIPGYQRGRTIGVPTANLRCDRQFIPADGVYAGRCMVEGTDYPAAVSIGTLPTFGEYDRQIEAHLIGFAGDLYGRVLTVELIDWLRDQRKYDGIEPLKVQIAIDLKETIRRAADDPSRPIAAA
ncbi:MAG: ribF [Phycisphaerales bacterium]|jgi:riboflavin kinase/FMN adenylyltransferase|nr:ribF [Phycisphaerales bacterium]